MGLTFEFDEFDDCYITNTHSLLSLIVNHLRMVTTRDSVTEQAKHESARTGGGIVDASVPKSRISESRNLNVVVAAIWIFKFHVRVNSSLSEFRKYLGADPQTN